MVSLGGAAGFACVRFRPGLIRVPIVGAAIYLIVFGALAGIHPLNRSARATKVFSGARGQGSGIRKASCGQEGCLPIIESFQQKGAARVAKERNCPLTLILET